MFAEEQDNPTTVPATPPAALSSRADGWEVSKEVTACCMPRPMLAAAGSAIYPVTAPHGGTAVTYSPSSRLPGSLFDVQNLFHLRLGSLWFPGSFSAFSEIKVEVFFFCFKGMWRGSHLQSTIWFSTESSKTVQEKMSPALAMRTSGFCCFWLVARLFRGC